VRNLITVLEKIEKEVPEDFTFRHNLFVSLNSIKDSFRYTAPEAMYIRWQEAGVALMEYLGEPNTEWKKKISLIFADKL